MPSDKIIAGNSITDDDPLQIQDAGIASANYLIPVVKSDSDNDPAGPFRGLLLDAAGVLKVTMASGEARTFISGELLAGVIHPMKVLRVWSTGTGAQGIKGAT